MDLAAVRMNFHYDDWFRKEPNVGYETLLYDVMIGDPTLFMRADMVEQTWRIVQPVLDAWANDGESDPAIYQAGSSGPAEADGHHGLSLHAGPAPAARRRMVGRRYDGGATRKALAQRISRPGHELGGTAAPIGRSDKPAIPVCFRIVIKKGDPGNRPRRARPSGDAGSFLAFAFRMQTPALMAGTTGRA